MSVLHAGGCVVVLSAPALQVESLLPPALLGHGVPLRFQVEALVED